MGKTLTSFHIEPEQHRGLVRLARRKGSSVAEEIRHAIDHHLVSAEVEEKVP